MAEVLSQSQIDMLLASLQGGDGDEPIEETGKKDEEKEYRKYDFYSPKKFTKDRLKLLKSIFDNYARIATSQINSIFRTASEIEVMAVEEQRYYEFSNALSDNDVMTLVQVQVPEHTKNPPLLVHATQLLMLSLIDRMMGGEGNDEAIDAGYTYTSIELALYKGVIKYIVKILDDAWAGHIDLKFDFQRLEETPSMFQEIGLDETIVIIVLDVTMRDVQGKINICMPGSLLTNIFEVLDKRKHDAMGDEYGGQNIKDEIFDNIRNSPLDVAASLGTARVSLEDIYNLQIGDVIDLAKPKDTPVTLYVEGQPWFSGQMGVHKRNVAVKIEDMIKDEELVTLADAKQPGDQESQEV